jgi:hypothetical protein
MWARFVPNCGATVYTANAVHFCLGEFTIYLGKYFS